MSLSELFKRFAELHRAEKLWLLGHPFVAAKALRVTSETQEAAARAQQDPELDADAYGGQVDAFRHGYWMARLAQEIGEDRARALGVAHEKAARDDHGRRAFLPEAKPDSTASRMDLLNNDSGIRIGLQNPEAKPDGIERLVREAVLNGEFSVILRDGQGRYLDWNRQPIPPEQLMGWVTPRVLVPSNFAG